MAAGKEIYIYFDSQYRDRTQHPSPFKFAMTKDSQREPISPSPSCYPIFYGQVPTGVAGITSTLTFPETYFPYAYAYENAFIDYYFVWIDTSFTPAISLQTKITASTATATECTLTFDPINITTDACYFFLRKGRNNFLATTTLTTKTLQLSSPIATGSYINLFDPVVFATTGPSIFPITKISGNIVTIDGILPALIDAYCEVVVNDTDSWHSLNQLPVAKTSNVYMVRLICLTLPDILITAPFGGAFFERDFVYVSLSNSSIKNSNSSLVTNTSTAPFAVSIDDARPRYGFLFYTLTNCEIEIPIHLDLRDQLYIDITFADGKTVSTYQDFASPYPPDPACQVTATFRLRQMF